MLCANEFVSCTNECSRHTCTKSACVHANEYALLVHGVSTAIHSNAACPVCVCCGGVVRGVSQSVVARGGTQKCILIRK